MTFKSSAVKSQNPPIKPSTALSIIYLNSLNGFKRKNYIFFKVVFKTDWIQTHLKVEWLSNQDHHQCQVERSRDSKSNN
jgi:hypothetical protein